MPSTLQRRGQCKGFSSVASLPPSTHPQQRLEVHKCDLIERNIRNSLPGSVLEPLRVIDSRQTSIIGSRGVPHFCAFHLLPVTACSLFAAYWGEGLISTSSFSPPGFLRWNHMKSAVYHNQIPTREFWKKGFRFYHDHLPSYLNEYLREIIPPPPPKYCGVE